jgi:serine/threonine protein kinase
MLETGSILWGQFRVEGFVDRGGMAEIYRVTDANGRDFAAKIIRPEHLQDQHARRQYLSFFRNEVAIHQQLQHEKIVRCYGILEEGNIIGMLMDFVAGKSLREQIHNHGAEALSSDQILTVCTQIGQALDYMHQLRICHCDIKPANILSDGNGQYLLTDFGISQYMGPSSNSGTSYYMSPEQFLIGEPVSSASDIYSFAITVYEMLTGGYRPFTDRTDEAANTEHSSSATARTLREQHLYEAPPPPSQFKADLSEATDTVILQALDKNPGQRFDSCSQFVGELSNALKPDFRTRLGNLLPGGISRRIIPMKPAQLVCTRGVLKGQTFPINRSSLLVGRSRGECDIHIPDKQVSRRHILIRWSEHASGGGGYYLQDQYSTYHSRVNGRLTQACRLHHLDLISVAGHNFRFELV